MQRADPQKNVNIRHTNDLNALGKIFRGCSASPATMETYSGPHILFRSSDFSNQKYLQADLRERGLDDTSHNTEKATSVTWRKVFNKASLSVPTLIHHEHFHLRKTERHEPDLSSTENHIYHAVGFRPTSL